MPFSSLASWPDSFVCHHNMGARRARVVAVAASRETQTVSASEVGWELRNCKATSLSGDFAPIPVAPSPVLERGDTSRGRFLCTDTHLAGSQYFDRDVTVTIRRFFRV